MRLVVALLAAASLATVAQAQTGSDAKRGFDPPISDEMVQGLSDAVLDGMPAMRCGEGPCAPATASDRAWGLLPRDDARELIRKGMVSQIGACAGVDWNRVAFAPMMADYRHRQKKSQRQLAYIAALHGAGMSVVLQSLGGSCPKN
jgi:hypothetical protein